MPSITNTLAPLLLLLLLPLLPATLAYTGDMTYYSPSVGLGSCGYQSGDNDDVVALSHEMMGRSANPNANPRCGTKIGIWNPYTKKHHQATIVDTCGACKKFDIDVSEGLFKRIAPNGDGRVKGMNWGGQAVGG